MRTTIKTSVSTLLALGVFLLGGCQTVQKDLAQEMVGNGKPRREVTKENDSGVQVPDLDQRKEDTQYLSKIDRLKNEVFDLRARLKKAESERDAAVSMSRAAQLNQSVLTQTISDYEGTLASATDREGKLKERLLRSELESVRFQQMLADMKIQQLTKGAGK